MTAPTASNARGTGPLARNATLPAQAHSPLIINTPASAGSRKSGYTSTMPGGMTFALGRFAQADTLIPEPGNPMAWDHFSYALNNPVRLSDPSGHKACEEGEGGKCENGKSDPLPNPPDEPTINLQTLITQWIWNTFPSAVGGHIGITVQGGSGAEVGITPIELLVLLNLHSGEVSIFMSYEGYGYLGTPNFMGSSVYFGSTSVYGLSQNENYAGPSVFAGLVASIDTFLQGGLSLIGGSAIDANNSADIPFKFFIDEGSGRTIEYHQVSLVFGGNVGANGVDLGGVAGAGSAKLLANIDIPFWPFGD